MPGDHIDQTSMAAIKVKRVTLSNTDENNRGESNLKLLIHAPKHKPCLV